MPGVSNLGGRPADTRPLCSPLGDRFSSAPALRKAAQSLILAPPACPDRGRSEESGLLPTFFVGRNFFSTKRVIERGGKTIEKTTTSTRIAELTPELEQIATAAGCELVHAELKGGVLRLVLDKPEGVTLTDCELVSKQASALLDVLDFGKSRYVLEVSSPGLDRQLYRPRDYERFTGKLARVTVVDPETGRKKTVVSRLAEYRSAPEGSPEGESEVVLADDKTGERQTVRLKDVQLARLEIEL